MHRTARSLLSAALVVNLTACATLSATTTVDPSQTLTQLAGVWWEATMERNPVWATSLGDRQRDDHLGDLSPVALNAHRALAEELLTRMNALDRGALSDSERVTADFLATVLKTTLAERACDGATWVVDQLYGPQVWLPLIPNDHSIRGAQDLETLIARYEAIPKYLRQHTDNLTRGLEAGRTAPRLVIDRVIAQLDEMASRAPEETPMVSRIILPDDWTDARRSDAREALAARVRDHVQPAFARFRAFLGDVLRPAARETVGVHANPDGAACYRARILEHVGAEMAPEAIHQIGLDEVARLHGEMAAIAKVVDGADDLQAFMVELRTRADQFVDTPEALADVARDAVARAQEALPRAFGKLPKTPVEVRLMEAFRAPTAPAAYYYPPPEDGSRPGIYYINTHDLPSRPLYNMEALAYHEAVPGHHLQIALASEMEDVPAFQQHAGQTAYVEGWALYGEHLCDELGLYTSPLSRFGALGYQVWRAARLVVDTGIHAMGWPREKAIDYMLWATPLARKEVVAEVERYIAWPGQALGYMLGRMHIQRLRAEAEAQLGPRFDLRSFHDEVLRYGAVPLEVLSGIVGRWATNH